MRHRFVRWDKSPSIFINSAASIAEICNQVGDIYISSKPAKPFDSALNQLIFTSLPLGVLSLNILMQDGF